MFIFNKIVTWHCGVIMLHYAWLFAHAHYRNRIEFVSRYGSKKNHTAFYRFCVVIVFFHPGHNGQWPQTSKDFSIPDFIYYIYFPILILEKEQVFPFECSVLNKGTTGTIFITSLVWRGPWLGIETRTSRTRSQHSTTSLSGKQLLILSVG